MKLELTAFVNNISAIEPLSKGFKQTVILWIPEAKDEMEQVIRREQFFKIEIWASTQTDKKFFNSTHIRSKIKATLYLNGERWMNTGSTEFSYNNKLKLAEWAKA